jgi:hypothetical protein|tara:strand:+ start:3115 stop:3678 length:564 start_codon:yes stop_codon:yes gene_type:complete
MKTKKNKIKNNKTKKMIFKEIDYKSNDGMLTSIWGPGMWHYLHSMSFNYPVNPSKEDKVNYMNFMKSLKNVLPCRKCRENLKNNYKKLPITLDTMKNRRTFSEYVYNLHELINKMLDKESGLSYEEVRERYEHFRSRCDKKVKTKDENGCVTPVYGEKAKCILKIVPAKEKCETLEIDNRCNKKIIK